MEEDQTPSSAAVELSEGELKRLAQDHARAITASYFNRVLARVYRVRGGNGELTLVFCGNGRCGSV
jgi:hypothetical protein